MNGLRSEIQQLKLEVKKRDGVIASLKTDIEGLKREIQERDATIHDKVSCEELLWEGGRCAFGSEHSCSQSPIPHATFLCFIGVWDSGMKLEAR